MNCTPIVRHHLTFEVLFFMTKNSLELKIKAVLPNKSLISQSIASHSFSIADKIKGAGKYEI